MRSAFRSFIVALDILNQYQCDISESIIAVGDNYKALFRVYEWLDELGLGKKDGDWEIHSWQM